MYTSVSRIETPRQGRCLLSQKFRTVSAISINNLVACLEHLCLSNGQLYARNSIPIDALLKQIKLKGIRRLELGWLWGLTSELINRLKDSKGTLYTGLIKNTKCDYKTAVSGVEGQINS